MFTSFESLLENITEQPVANAPLAVSYGRFNPPHKGHEKLVGELMKTQEQGYEPRLYVSSSVDSVDNPLSVEQKQKYIFDSFGVKADAAESVQKLLEKIRSEGDTVSLFVIGNEEEKGADGDNSQLSRMLESLGIQFVEVPIEPGISSSRMRAAAAENNFDSYMSMCPSKLHADEQGKTIAKEKFNNVRSGMGMKDEPSPEVAPVVEQKYVLSFMRLLRESSKMKDFVKSRYSRKSGIPHIEDMVLAGELDNIIKKFKSIIAGDDIRIKYDGSIAVFFGISPTNGQFFVASKGIMNTNPIVFYGESDIANYYAEKGSIDTIGKKLMVAFKHLKPIVTSGIWCGDLLWARDLSESLRVDGDCWVFKPNICEYKVPIHSASGKKIAVSDIGIAIHSMYDGQTFETIVRVEPNFSKLVPLETTRVWCPNYEVNTKGLAFDDAGVQVNELSSYASKTNTTFQSFLDTCDVERVQKYLSVSGTPLELEKFVESLSPEEAAFIQVEDLELYRTAFDIINKVVALKKTIITCVNRLPLDVLPTIGGSVANEGYVVTLGDDTLVKLVDRKAFTEVNRQAHTGNEVIIVGQIQQA